MPQPRALLPLLVVATAALVAAPYGAVVRAQEGVVRDDTLGAGRNEPVPSAQTAEGKLEYLIGSDLGRLGAGDRILFHSFRDFNLTADEIATFQGPDSVVSIIARVTGGSRSSIDGRLRSEMSNSNLFFLNPGGVLFGPNATLDLPGSFFASSAQQLRLTDGAIFDARPGGAVPLLSIASPETFGFLNANAPIEVDGSFLALGHGSLGLIGSDVSLRNDASLEVIAPVGAEIPSVGDVLIMAGGRVSLESSRVFSELGDISIIGDELHLRDASVSGSLQTAIFEDPPAIADLLLRGREIDLTDSDVGAEGNVRMTAERIRLFETSVNAAVGGIFLEASDELSIAGTTGPPLPRSPDDPNPSTPARCGPCGNTLGFKSAFTASTIELRAPDVWVDGVALYGDDTRIWADRILFENGARVAVETALRNGDPADVQRSVALQASESITFRNRAGIFLVSFFRTPFPGRGGPVSPTISLSTSELVVEDQSVIAAGTLLPLLLDPFPPQFQGNPGPAGVIEIDADRVFLRTGGQIDSSSLSGEAAEGRIDIRARELIDIAGAGTGLFSVSVLDGPAGRILLRAPRVVVRDGAVISSETTLDPRLVSRPFELLDIDFDLEPYKTLPFGVGRAGLISIEGDSIAIANGARISSATSGAGDGGLIRLTARDSISITGGGSITADSTGTGNAGRIELLAGRSVRLEDALVATSSASTSGGDIRIQANVVDLNRSRVSTNVGSGDGGNIEIESDALILRSGSEVVARAKEGTGGRISINSRAFLRTPDSVVDASSDLGVDGIVDLRSPAVDLNASLAVLASAYIDPAERLVERCELRDREGEGSFRLGGRDGMPETPERGLAARYSRIPTPLGPADRGDYDHFLRERPTSGLDRVEDLVRAAEVLEALGELTRARELLELAMDDASRSDAGRISALRGRLWARAGAWGNAERDFVSAERLAEETGDARLLAQVFLDWGGAERERGRTDVAHGLQARALKSAERSSDPDVRARTRAALARGESELSGALTELLALPATHDRLYAAISVGRALAALPDDSARIRAGEAFTRIAERAQDLKDHAAASYAWGHLAELYAREQRTAEATELARRALAAAGRADRPESAYLWGAALGRLLQAAGDLDGATRAYEAGLQAAEQVRSSAALSVRAQTELASAFPAHELGEGLVDVLLTRAEQTQDAAARLSLLRAVRSRLESSRRREIRDYFQDECVALERVTSLDALPDTLVVYPILLRDRAEILVSSTQGIERIRIPAPTSEVRAALASFRLQLEDLSTHDYRAPASLLYQWLIEPLAPWVTADSASRTLVFVGAGPFAGVPFAALYDAKQHQFLIEQHPVAVSPGLSLIEPRPLERRPHSALQAALTSPVGDLPALVSARAEVAQIHALIGGKTLIDTQFGASALDRELASFPYEMVHIASHGRFAGPSEGAYLLTADGRIGMSEMADLVSQTRFRTKPLELLALSACETAAGDDRAALGLAGVAVRAGARSTLASLWAVNDPSTARLMGEFYRALVAGSSRGRALQLAQQALLADPVYRHPAYWSPFVLIGSWR